MKSLSKTIISNCLHFPAISCIAKRTLINSQRQDMQVQRSLLKMESETINRQPIQTIGLRDVPVQHQYQDISKKVHSCSNKINRHTKCCFGCNETIE